MTLTVWFNSLHLFQSRVTQLGSIQRNEGRVFLVHWITTTPLKMTCCRKLQESEIEDDQLYLIYPKFY